MSLRWDIGHTARGGRRTPGLHPEGPVLHAATRRPASRTGRNVLALCGTSILPEADASVAGTFDPHGGRRSCPTCQKFARHKLAQAELARQGVDP